MNQRESTTDAAIRVDLGELLALAAQARGNNLAEPRRSAAARSGLHASRWRGRGVDFRESRIYQAGDDIRHMDWRVTARSGRPHTKLFEEEREHGLLLMLDFNPGMRFGTRVRFKSVQAARAASLLAWMATQSGDRVGALGFGGGVHAELKPAGGRRGVLQVLRNLRDWDHAANQEREDLGVALERARRLLRPGTRMILLSDGFSADEGAWPILARCAARHELGCVLVSDVLEQAPPPPDRYAIRTDRGRRLIDLTRAAARAQWSQPFIQVRERVRQEFARMGARVVELTTDADLRGALAPFTRRRQAPQDSQA